MADYAISNVPRRVVYANTGVGPYAFTFEILDQTDIAVYRGSTLLTLTTDYSVTINSNGTGSITLVTAGTGNITIVGARAIQRTSDYTTGGDLFASTLNTDLDSQTIYVQQVAETAERGLKAPVVDPTDINMTLPSKTARAGTFLAFDSPSGNPIAGPSIASVGTVTQNIANVNTVAADIANVNTVAGISANVTTVAGIAGNVTTVANNNANVTTVATDLSGADNIGTVAGDIANVNAVGSNIANVNTVAGIDTEITTVAGIDTEITTVSGIASDVSAVAAIDSDVTTVAGIDSDVTAVAADATDIGAVASNIANVNSVAGNSTNINAVAGNATNINTVAGISSNVTTVAGISANVTTVAGISANVTTVAGISSDVTTVATNVADITNYADTYLGPKTSDPSVRNDSSALQAGDLYFNTADDVMKVYDGSVWQAAYVSLSGALIATNNLSDLTNASTARQNLDLEIGVDVQAYDADTAKYDDTTANFTGTLQNGGSNVVVDSDIGTAVQAYSAELQGATQGGINGMKNRIINGAMMIDQRNAGASVTPAQDNFMTDRWKWGQSQSSKFTAQQSTTAPSGFTNSLLMTVTSAVTVGSSDYFSVYQPIEGLNVSDLGWGTANAQPVTLSFKVRSSLTGTFGGAIRNSAGNRSYPFTYTISSANTFEDKTVTIAGDTSGTWLTTNGVGMYVQFSLGVGTTLSGTAGSWAGANYLSATGATSVVGTNGATFYITGVQLEVGSTATSFDYRPYGTELQLCQRYYQKIAPTTQFNDMAFGNCATTTEATAGIYFRTSMRVAPSALETTGTAANYAVSHSGTNSTCNAVPTFGSSSTEMINIGATVASGLTVGRGCSIRSASGVTTAYLAWSAEL